MKYIIGPRPFTSAFVKPATLDTEIPVLKSRDQHRYTGYGSRAEFLAEECREAKFACFQMAAEPRTIMEAHESTDK